MNRFFSKLNLADIKIKAEGNSFPPDADEDENQIEQRAEALVESPVATATETVVEEVAEVFTSEPEAPFASNGYSTREYTYEESTALYHAPKAEETNRSEDRQPVTEIISDGIVIGIGEVLKVSARSRPSAVAGAIAGVVREAGKAEVQAIGAGATNQAIKAVAIARDYLSESGIEAVCVPAFIDVTIENEDRTAIRLVVEPR